jgi:hypothetical protein
VGNPVGSPRREAPGATQIYGFDRSEAAGELPHLCHAPIGGRGARSRRGAARLPGERTDGKMVRLRASSRWPSCRAMKAARTLCSLSAATDIWSASKKRWQRVRWAAGLNDVRLHDLRHSFASIAVSGGDSLYLGKVLGHRQSRTTERYAHLKDDPLRATANRTSERIAAIMRGGRDTKVVPMPSPKGAE